MPSLPAVPPLFSLLAIPLTAYSAHCARSLVEAPVITTPHHNLLSSASTLLATITFGFMWFSRLPTTSEMLTGILFLYSQSYQPLRLVSNPDPYRWIPQKATGFRWSPACSCDTGCPLSFESHNVEPRVAKNLLFSCAQLSLHDGTNAVRYLDE